MSNDLLKKAKELLEAGYSYAQIGDELGISKSAAYRLLNENQDDNTVKGSFGATEEPNRGRGSTLQVKSDAAVQIRKMELDYELKLRQFEAEEKDKQRHLDQEKLKLLTKIDTLEKEISDYQDEIIRLKEVLDAKKTKVQEDETLTKLVRYFTELKSRNNRMYYKDEINEMLEQVEEIRDSFLVQYCLKNGVKIRFLIESQIISEVIKTLKSMQTKLENKGIFESSNCLLNFNSELYNKITKYITDEN